MNVQSHVGKVRQVEQHIGGNDPQTSTLRFGLSVVSSSLLLFAYISLMKISPVFLLLKFSTKIVSRSILNSLLPTLPTPSWKF